MDPSIVPIVAKEAKEVSKPLSGAIAGTLAEFWHGIVGDRVTAWRLRNAAKVSKKLEAEIAERGVVLKTDALPESYAFRWFDKASEEDEPQLQALFAKLLASAASGHPSALERQNIDLVSRLTPDAANLVALIAEKYCDARNRLEHHRYSISDIGSEVYFANGDLEDHFELATAILISLGILRESIELVDFSPKYSVSWKPTTSHPQKRITDTAKLEQYLTLTILGANLIDALYPPEEAEIDISL